MRVHVRVSFLDTRFPVPHRPRGSPDDGLRLMRLLRRAGLAEQKAVIFAVARFKAFGSTPALR